MKCSSWFLCLTFTQVTMSQSGEYADDSILWLSEDGDTALDDAMLFVDELLMGDDSFLLDSALETATELESSRPNGEIGDRQTANSASTKGKTKSRKRPDRRKELEDLRATVSSLESKLSELKQEYRRVDAEDPLSRVWGGIASRQLDERRRTEVENLKLREMVEDKFRLIRKLEKLLKRPGGDEIALPTKRLRLTTGLSPLESPLVYEDLRQRVDANYAEVDSVFAKPIFDDAAVEPIRIVRLRGDHVNGAIVESVDQVVFPFGYMEVADAAWSLLKTHTLAEPLFSRHLHDVSLSDDTITKELKSVMDGTVYHAKLLCRRFIESNRVVIVTNMLVDPDSIGGKSMDGLYMRAGMWQVIQPASIDRPGRPAAVRRIYHTAVPEMYSLAEESEDSMEQRHRATILTNLVLKSVNTSVDFGNHQLESLLMDRMARLTLQ
ncbi:hypothetical protein Poli38472_004860 [Pythium oligandrum]|uniref:Uncharacterized protein n=1 Tax=Pythium oligandrum TaxID=41045 RepID=A0A8K1FET6_PYTOL|nr:hypothetical protein Poli38472_004860 [Pythium oligandrum]|eukprot:TMW59791.1 hypothetical protein Poli38472_004860 [Pythium oligandrum]